jgi:Icc-related predicted phosphoesterase
MDSERIKSHWNNIPEDVNILITHQPPKNILDITKKKDNAGCPYLQDKI